MSLAALPKIAANSRDAKEANIKDFVGYELAKHAGSAAGPAASVYSLVARAPDSPVVRAITKDAAGKNNSFAALVAGVAKSVPFQMRVARVARNNNR